MPDTDATLRQAGDHGARVERAEVLVEGTTILVRIGADGSYSLPGIPSGGVRLLARRPLPYGDTGRDVMLADVGAGARWHALQLDVDVYNALDASWLDGEFVYASAARSAAPSLVPQRHVTVGSPRTLWVTGTLRL